MLSVIKYSPIKTRNAAASYALWASFETALWSKKG
jgi:hypothetical protein